MYHEILRGTTKPAVNTVVDAVVAPPRHNAQQQRMKCPKHTTTTRSINNSSASDRVFWLLFWQLLPGSVSGLLVDVDRARIPRYSGAAVVVYDSRLCGSPWVAP